MTATLIKVSEKMPTQKQLKQVWDDITKRGGKPEVIWIGDQETWDLCITNAVEEKLKEIKHG